MIKVLKVNGVIIGKYDDELDIYYKKVQESKHRMWKHNGYGIQLVAVERLQELGCKVVLIKEVDTNTTWRSEFNQWLQSTIVEEHLPHGVQKFLPIDDMKKFNNIKER